MSARNDDAASLDPDALASHLFGTSFRGFDQDEVRSYLSAVAAAVTALHQERDALSRRLAESQDQPAAVADLDEDQLTAALGAETARVLGTARHAATEIRTKAEDNVARLLRDAADEAAATRTEADEYATTTRTEADEYAATTRTAADEHAAAARAEADEYVTALREEVDAYAVAARAEADEQSATTRADADAYAATTRADADAYAGTTRTDADAQAATVRADADAAATAARTAADEAATRAVTDAEAAAATIREAAEAHAAQVRTEAEGILEVRTTEAEAAASQIRAEAEAVKADAVRLAADAVEAGKEEGRALVAEAQQVREKVLKDLARRRKAARAQIEQLRAARDRLLEGFDVIRRATDEATSEMLVALPEARVAALAAGRRAEADDEDTVAELEAEIAAARAAGLLSPPDALGPDPIGAEPISAEPVTEDPAGLEAALGPITHGDQAPPPSEVAAVAELDDPAADEPAALDDTTELDVITIEPLAAADAVTPADPPAADADAVLADAGPAVDAGPAGPAASTVDDRVPGQAGPGPTPSAAPAAPRAQPVETPATEAATATGSDASDSEAVADPTPKDAATESPADGEVIDLAAAAADGPTPDVIDLDGLAAEPDEIDGVDGGFDDAEDLGGIPADVHPPDEVLAAPGPDGVIDLRLEPEDGAADPADDEPAAAEPNPEAAAEVDALFARLRESRRDSVLRATAVLAGEGDAEDAADSADDGEGLAFDEVGLVTLLERRDGLTEPIEHQLSRRVKRVLADEQNSVLDAVRRAKGFPSAVDVLPTVDGHRAAYIAAVADDLTAAVAAGASFQGGDADAPTGDTTELAVALADEIIGLIRPRVEHSFTEVDGDEDELTALIRSAYREWKTQRIAELCRHHVLVAFSQGQFAVLPEGSGVQWVIDDSGAPCPDAEDNALAGVVVKGEAFPTGHCASPAHPGCRCLVIPARQ